MSFLHAVYSNRVLANVLLVSIVGLGVMAATSMKREGNPNVNFDYVNAFVSLPGADPQEVEEGIARRMETVVDGMEGVKQYFTTSSEGAAYLTVELADGFDAEEMRDRLDEALSGISTFPADTRRPVVTVEREEEEVINLALWGPAPERQLKEWAERTRNDLQRMPEVSQVNVGDARSYAVNIEVSQESLRQYDLTLEDVTAAVRQASFSTSAGAIRTEGEEIRIRALGRRDHGKAFRDIVVKAGPDGNVLTLGRLADVQDGFSDYKAYGRFNGSPCVILEIYKARGDDSIAISEAVQAYARRMAPTLPEGLYMTPCFDESEFVRGQISMLVENGLLGLGIVLVVLWLFLNSTLSFWAAMGIPISVSGSLAILWMSGGSINEITLVAFIIALGIIVDDAIVVGEAIFHHRQSGEGPLDAAVAGVREVGLPVLAAVATTVAAFVPMMFVPGPMGKIMFWAPVVVIGALAVSLVECLFLLPAHLNHLPDPERKSQQRKTPWQHWRTLPSRAMDRFAEGPYTRLVRAVVRHRYLSLCAGAAVLMFSFGAVDGGFIKVEFWPPSDGTYLSAFLEFPQGTPAEVTEDALNKTAAAARKVAQTIATRSGDPLIRNLHVRLFPGAPNQGRVLVELVDPSDRDTHSQDISAAWEEELGLLPGAVAQTFYKDTIGIGGPPIAIWLQGPDMDALRDASEKLKAHLRNYDGVYDVRDDFRPGKTEVQLTLKPEAHTLGLTLDRLTRQVRAGFYGEEALRFQRGRDDVIVRVRYPEEERGNLSDLEKMRVRTPAGHEVPLMSVAEITLAQGYTTIRSSNGLRRLAVWAGVDSNKVKPNEVITDLKGQYLDKLTRGYAGMTWSFRGASEHNQTTLGGLQRGFMVAMLAVFVVMATIFRSYLQPFVILLVIPFGIVGAFFGHWVLGIPVTFLSMFGIVALTGVVVNDAIVLIECVNDLLAEGYLFLDAVCQGGRRRFRAIVLTSLSTCGGLVPLLMERDLQAQIVIPMAASIAFGVAFATVLTLLFLPALLGILNDLRRLTHFVLFREWVSAEAVEPARLRRGGQAAGTGGESLVAAGPAGGLQAPTE